MRQMMLLVGMLALSFAMLGCNSKHVTIHRPELTVQSYVASSSARSDDAVNRVMNAVILGNDAFTWIHVPIPSSLDADMVIGAALEVPITSASVQHWMDSKAAGSVSLTLGVYRVIEPVPSVIATRRGMERVIDPVPISTTKVTDEVKGISVKEFEDYIHFDMSALMEDWLRGEPNHGFIIKPTAVSVTADQVLWMHLMAPPPPATPAEKARAEAIPPSTQRYQDDSRQIQLLLWHR